MKLSSVFYSSLIGSALFALFNSQEFNLRPISNPYDLGIQAKENLNTEDYLKLQKVLDSKKDEIEKFIRTVYPTNRSEYAVPEAFVGRCSRGVWQTLIDPEKGWFPEVILEKINEGGDQCIVTSVPYFGKYPELARAKTEQLRQTGFNGYYLYFVGGYPNPTGQEIQFVGVPYAMKIFAMLDAQKRGFQQVLWVDSAAMPLRDPSPLFEWLEKKGAFIHGWVTPEYFGMYLLPETHQLLKDLTGTDILKSLYINSVVFGLKMDAKLTGDFISSYFDMLKLGTPFLSCFPEECVFMALYGQPKFKEKWGRHYFPNLIHYLDPHIEDSPERIEAARHEGAFFYQCRH